MPEATDQVQEQILNLIRSRYYGKYRGIVTDNKDKTGRGRVKVKVPAVHEDLEIWATPCLPYAGDNVGMYYIPEPGAGVWVEFEAGDISFPIYSGGYWVNDELPKFTDGQRAKPSRRMLRSQKGLQISLDDDGEIVTIADKDGKHVITIDVPAGKVRIAGTQKIIVDAPKIELVENAEYSVVLGEPLRNYLDMLVQMFNTHIHPAVVGMTPVVVSPPMVPARPTDPSLLSVKVKTG